MKKEELNFSKKSSEVDESTVSSKSTTNDDSDINNPAEKKFKEEPPDDNILENTLEMRIETREEEFQLPPEHTAVIDPAGKKIKEEPQNKIELFGEPVFPSTPAPLSGLKAENEKEKERENASTDKQEDIKPKMEQGKKKR